MFVERGRDAVHVGEERGSLLGTLCTSVLRLSSGFLHAATGQRSPQAEVQGDDCSSRRRIAQCVGVAEGGGEATDGGSE